MSERIEATAYVIRDADGSEWYANEYDHSKQASAKAMRDKLAASIYAKRGPFTVWVRTITESPLAPGAPETAP